MHLTMTDALKLPQIKQCQVAAGMQGLNREIESINSFDAPDVLSWLKPNELILTTGYLFQDNPQQLDQFVIELAKMNCSGLFIKLEEIPQTTISIANMANLPILKIPPEYSLSDIMSPLLREIVTRQNEQKEQSYSMEDVSGVGAENLSYGILGMTEDKSSFQQITGGFICTVLPLTLQWNQRNDSITYKQLIKTIETLTEQNKIDKLIRNIKGSLVIIYLDTIPLGSTRFYSQVTQISQQIISTLSKHLPMELTLGVGNYHTGINNLANSLQEALQSIDLGKRSNPGKEVYGYKELITFKILQYAPKHVLMDIVTGNLAPLKDHDDETQSDLIKTLEAYLQCNLRPAETARKMGVHRNTIHFRIKSIKKLLGMELSNDDLFTLKLALYAKRLLDNR
ncbi:PucR family transcriptional regulator [Peribacillus frigoritolerans]|uniref:PucR family transcriptional regulator n=1 Tax=Peribacillus castrilensis TaxID=2897690 RepID=UPI002DCCCC23|nr:PucR family transcriptional regulator ligand-binding domain-containing protein [Peribacillus castrilensis]